MRVDLSRVHYPVTTLGPGRRIGVWFQGCSIGCSGCISPDTWARGEGQTTVDALMAMVTPWLSEADGLTVSGGEPFEQPQALAIFLQIVRQRADLDVLVFSGLPYASLEPWLETHPGLIDALMSEPFEKSAPQTLALRGSDNQILHQLTDRGRSRFNDFERKATAADRRLDVMFDEAGGASFAGIPARGDFDRLRKGLREAGHQLTLKERIDAR